MADYDRARSAMVSSRAAYQAAHARYNAACVAAQNQLDQARRQYELARTTLENFRITSLVSGRVLGKYRNVGELVTVQQPVLLLGRGDQRYLDIYCDVADAHRLRIGATVLYTLDAYPDSIFTATVTTIYPAIDAATQSIHVEARCTTAPPAPVDRHCRPSQHHRCPAQGCTGDPRRAVQPDSTVVLRSGERRRVQLGIGSLEYVEVTSGLADGDEVAVP